MGVSMGWGGSPSFVRRSAGMNDSGFFKGGIAIINTETLQMQNGQGVMLEGSMWEQVLGPRMAALAKALDEVRQSKIQDVHIATERA